MLIPEVLLQFLIPKTIAKSRFNGEIKISYSYGIKTLWASGVPQSGGELVSMWTQVLDDLKRQKLKPKTCLMLGVGGWMIPRLLEKRFPKIQTTGIEIDSLMLAAAKTYFGAGNQKNEQLILAEAGIWVKQAKPESFDLIVMDIFAIDHNPPNLRKRQFLLELKRLLKPHGLILYNSHFRQQHPGEYRRFLKLCQMEFRRVDEVFINVINRILLLQ